MWDSSHYSDTAEDISKMEVTAPLNALFKLAIFANDLCDVSSENKVFVRLIVRVQHDLEEIERLLIVPDIQAVLANNQEKLSWIKGAISSTKTALNEISMYVEQVRMDGVNGETNALSSLAHRVRWVVENHDKLITRTSELAICHQTLTIVLGSLHTLETVQWFRAVTPVNDSSQSQHSLGFRGHYTMRNSRLRISNPERKQYLLGDAPSKTPSYLIFQALC